MTNLGIVMVSLRYKLNYVAISLAYMNQKKAVYVFYN